MAELGPNEDMREILENIETAELDSFRLALASVLIEHTDLSVETIYSLAFYEGRKIIWS